MHLVFLNQYYPPDAAPTGVMLEGLVEGLLRDGHQVSVLCAAGGYAGKTQGDTTQDARQEDDSNVELSTSNVERRTQGDCGCGQKHAMQAPPPIQLTSSRATDNSSSSLASCVLPSCVSSSIDRREQNNHSRLCIIRIGASKFGRNTFAGKLLDYTSYYLGATWKLLTLPVPLDRVVALTTPPYLSVIARLVSKLRGADHAHWVMDLYPDVLAAHGMLDERGLLYRLLAGLARWGMGGKRCAAVLTLGPDMAERVSGLLGGGGSRLLDETRDEKAHDAKFDRDLNIEHPASQIERATNEVRRGVPETCAKASPKTRRQKQASVSWVPLWGAEALGSNGQAGQDMICSAAGNDGRLPAGNSGSTLGKGAASSADFGDSRSSIQKPSISAGALALRRARGWGDEDLVVMYSGNMGLGHRFGEVLAAAKDWRSWMADRGSGINEAPKSRATTASVIQDSSTTPQDPPASIFPPGRRLRFVFYGGGKRRGEVEEFVLSNPGSAIELYDYASAGELAAHLQSADVHLASLDPMWTGMMVPSKVQGIFAAARPVIFIGSGESSIGKWVLESGGGWVVAADHVVDLQAALTAACDPSALACRGTAAKVFAELHFDRQTNIARIISVLAGSGVAAASQPQAADAASRGV
ncbi:MAG: hypothetical protein WCJ66_03575 [Verrucomicrobiota bacterium]